VLLIAKGRVGDDKSVGNYTYISNTGKIIIDYVLLRDNVFHCIANIYIDDPTESCHLPLVALFYSNVECDNINPPFKRIRDHVNYF